MADRNSSPSPYRAGSPLTTRGRRTAIHLSPATRALVASVARDYGVTQRKLVDAVLSDRKILHKAAILVAGRITDARDDKTRAAEMAAGSSAGGAADRPPAM